MFNVRFSPEVSAGQVLIALSLAGSVFAAYSDITKDIALIKQSQAAQVQVNQALVTDIREIRRDVADIRAGEAAAVQSRKRM